MRGVGLGDLTEATLKADISCKDVARRDYLPSWGPPNALPRPAPEHNQGQPLDVLAEEPSLPEVLTQLQRRAEREPQGSGPASRWLRRLEEERAALWSAMGRRLSLNEETLSLSEGTLTERLTRIQALVFKPVSVPPQAEELRRPEPLRPGPGELVLLEGNGLLQPFGTAISLLAPWLALIVPLLLISDSAHPVAYWVILGLIAAFWAFFHLRSGRYWLTSERLLWQPRWGDPVEVPLSSIGEHSIAVTSWGTVKVDALGGICLRHVPRARALAALLSIRCRKEFRDVAAARGPQRELVLLHMGSTQPGQPLASDEAWGWIAVLRPGFVAFFSTPDARGDLLLDAITEPPELSLPPAKGLRDWIPGARRLLPGKSRDQIPVPLSLLIGQLQLLPEERMDAMLRKAASSDTGNSFWGPRAFLWEARELTWNQRGPRSLELSLGDKSMWAELSWQETEAVKPFLAGWKALPLTPETSGAEPPK